MANLAFVQGELDNVSKSEGDFSHLRALKYALDSFDLQTGAGI